MCPTSSSKAVQNLFQVTLTLGKKLITMFPNIANNSNLSKNIKFTAKIQRKMPLLAESSENRCRLTQR